MNDLAEVLVAEDIEETNRAAQTEAAKQEDDPLDRPVRTCAATPPRHKLTVEDIKRRVALAGRLGAKRQFTKPASPKPASPKPEAEKPTDGGWGAAVAESRQARDEPLAELTRGAKKVGEFEDPTPDLVNPRAILRDKYLRRGQMMLFVSTLGSGKSTFVSQATECWAVGKTFMGFAPARPIKAVVFETEDDADEVADFRNNFRRGFLADGWTQREIDEAERGRNAPLYIPTGHRSGDKFLDLVEYVAAHVDFDLLVMNPFYDFIGGNFNAADEVKAFLSRLTTIAEERAFAVLVVHHTGKIPSSAKERDGWLTGDAAAYSGSGSMVLPSSARAVVFMRSMGVQGFFELIAAKRGKRLGWTDAEGNPTTVRYIAHSDGMIYWREPTPEEVTAVDTVKKLGGSKLPKLNHTHDNDVAAVCEANGVPFVSKNALYAALMKRHSCQKSTAVNWVKAALEAKVVVEREAAKDGSSSNILIGLESQFGGGYTDCKSV